MEMKPSRSTRTRNGSVFFVEETERLDTAWKLNYLATSMLSHHEHLSSLLHVQQPYQGGSYFYSGVQYTGVSLSKHVPYKYIILESGA